MRKLIAVPAVLAAIILIGGCASVQPPPIASTEVAIAKQTVKIYDLAPPNASPIEQMNATACGSQEAATDQLIALTSQRGGNGIAQLSCKDEGFSMACWSSASTCTGTALVVTTPPPVAPPPKAKVKRRPKPKAPPRAKTP